MDGSTAEYSNWKKQNQRKNEEKNNIQKEMFHVIHKVPSGDGPYVRAKHAQLVQKDPEAAIVWFWKAINAGDRVDSALKDMAVVMKQLDRTEEAIEAIKSFRVLCPKQAQESLDNVLIDLYKKCGRIDEQILLLKQKLRMIYLGEAFNGKPTKTARSHGKKFQVSIKQETSRILGNLAWAYMQKSNYIAAEVIYRKAQMIEADGNKASNLCVSLMKQSRYEEARLVIEDVLNCKLPGSNDLKTRIRAFELLEELEANSKINNNNNKQQQPTQSLVVLDVSNNISKLVNNNNNNGGKEEEDDFVEELDRLLKNVWGGAPPRTKRLPIFEEISAYCRDQIAC